MGKMNNNNANPFEEDPTDDNIKHPINFDPVLDITNNPFASSSRADDKKTLLDTIAAIERKDTNYIFLFGRPATGKSYITASLIYYLKTTRLGDLHLSPSTSRESVLLFEDMYNNFQSGKILDRTNTAAPPYEIDLIFRPKDTKLPDMRITFLEMSGENLKKVQITKDDIDSGKLPDNIDIYFLCKNIKLIFFLVADHENASRDSLTIDQFLQYVFNKSSKFNNANCLLAITKWDTYNGRHRKKIGGFTLETMPNIHNRLINERVGHAITHYSIGKILRKQVNGIDTELIQEINTDRAEAVANWLYKTITKRSLIPEPGTWDKIKNFMGFSVR